MPKKCIYYNFKIFYCRNSGHDGGEEGLDLNSLHENNQIYN